MLLIEPIPALAALAKDTVRAALPGVDVAVRNMRTKDCSLPIGHHFEIAVPSHGSGCLLAAGLAPDILVIAVVAVPWGVLPADRRTDIVDAAGSGPVRQSAEERTVSQRPAGRVLPVTHLFDARDIAGCNSGTARLFPALQEYCHVLQDLLPVVFNPGTEIFGKTPLPPPPPLAAVPALPAYLSRGHVRRVCVQGHKKKMGIDLTAGALQIYRAFFESFIGV